MLSNRDDTAPANNVVQINICVRIARCFHLRTLSELQHITHHHFAENSFVKSALFCTLLPVVDIFSLNRRISIRKFQAIRLLERSEHTQL